MVNFLSSKSPFLQIMSFPEKLVNKVWAREQNHFLIGIWNSKLCIAKLAILFSSSFRIIWKKRLFIRISIVLFLSRNGTRESNDHHYEKIVKVFERKIIMTLSLMNLRFFIIVFLMVSSISENCRFSRNWSVTWWWRNQKISHVFPKSFTSRISTIS